ncbi:hypothetical protein SUGI_0235840 [Cryptomeria japonica]|nr:hypothetical protein SUGI_0235840 [Cryptomeria japonica]
MAASLLHGSILLDDTSTFTGRYTIKSRLEAVCSGVVSCADIVTIAARDSVVLLGGPTWTVQLGSRDSASASLSGANSNLPSPSSDLSTVISAFQAQGLSTKDMVALSGAHKQDAPISDLSFSMTAISILHLPPLFRQIVQKGLLHSDQELFNGGSADALVTTYSTNPTTFFSDFAAAMVNMGNISPLTGTSGEVRTNCRKIN